MLSGSFFGSGIVDEVQLNFRNIVRATLGGFGAISPEGYQSALRYIAEQTGRTVDDQFRADVRKVLESLPCPLD
jgi:hypothetical protein